MHIQLPQSCTKIWYLNKYTVNVPFPGMSPQRNSVFHLSFKSKRAVISSLIKQLSLSHFKTPLYYNVRAFLDICPSNVHSVQSFFPPFPANTDLQSVLEFPFPPACLPALCVCFVVERSLKKGVDCLERFMFLITLSLQGLQLAFFSDMNLSLALFYLFFYSIMCLLYCFWGFSLRSNEIRSISPQ